MGINTRDEWRGRLIRHPVRGRNFVGRAIARKGNVVVVRWPDGRRYSVKADEAEVVEPCACCGATGYRRAAPPGKVSGKSPPGLDTSR